MGYSENVNVNDDPIVNNPIADVVLNEGDYYPSNIDPDALGWFSDADGDNLTYTFHWPEDAADDVETLEQFNNLNATELAYIGEESVTVIATDPSGATATQTMKFIVEPTVIIGHTDSDTVTFSGNYADYTITQSDDKSTLQVVDNRTDEGANQEPTMLRSIEHLQFDDVLVDVNNTNSGGELQVNSYTENDQTQPDAIALADGGFVITWNSV